MDPFNMPPENVEETERGKAVNGRTRDRARKNPAPRWQNAVTMVLMAAIAAPVLVGCLVACVLLWRLL